MDALVLSSGLDDALREENWKLKQFLRGSESTQRRLERQNRALQRRIQQLEAQLTTRQPRVRESSTKSEREWMVEHDNNVRALLHIIRHHEAAKEVLQREVQHLRAKEAAVDAVVKVSRSAQTDRSHGRWCMVSGEGDQETHTQADACIKHLRDQLQQIPKASAWCGASTSQELLIRSSSLTPPSRSDFRSSVMKRLSHRQPPPRPVVRPLPILEGDEEEDDQERHNTAPQVNQPLGKDQSSAEVSSPSGRLVHYRGLEEQNRRLQERLESQQSLLDQLLSIKLDQVSSPSSSKLARSACDAPTSSEKTTQDLEQAGMSSSATLSLREPVETSGKLDKQPTIPIRGHALRLDPTTGISTPQPPPQLPHPMSPHAA